MTFLFYYESINDLIVCPLQVRMQVGILGEILEGYGEDIANAVVRGLESPGEVPDTEADKIRPALVFPPKFATSFCKQGIGVVYIGSIDEGHAGQGLGFSYCSQLVDKGEPVAAGAHLCFGYHEHNVCQAEQNEIIAGVLIGSFLLGEVRCVFEETETGSLDSCAGYGEIGWNFSPVGIDKGVILPVLDRISLLIVLLADQDTGSHAGDVGDTLHISATEA